MKFVTIREFRNETAKIRKDLEAEREVVLTANGRPFALLSRVEPDSVEDEVLAVRRARARIAIDRMRAQAKARGLDKMTMEDVDAFIADVRRRRRASR
jgi:antitoxin (DNA-binding transcriptional repressor) of toxin-antitoxin stability system